MKCSTNSRHNQEQWLGSASPAQVWIALSHPKPWGASALTSIAIGDQNRKHLTAIFSLYADSRIQIITQDNSSEIVLFFAVAFEHDQRLYRIPLANYDGIRDLNWQDIIDNKPAYQKYLSPNPIYLICTNDQHDPCCGKWGQALFWPPTTKHWSVRFPISNCSCIRGAFRPNPLFKIAGLATTTDVENS